MINRWKNQLIKSCNYKSVVFGSRLKILIIKITNKKEFLEIQIILIKMKVLFCGNAIMGDDGIGHAVLDALKKDKRSIGLELIEVMWGGLSILDHFASDEKVVIIDAMQFGKEPGTIFRINFNELPADDELNFTTMHDLGVVEAINLGKSVMPEKIPKEIIFIGIQISTVTEFRKISGLFMIKIPEIIDLILKEKK